MPISDITRDNQRRYSKAPERVIDPDKTYIATLKTDHGDIVIELAAKDAPNTVNNFVYLASVGYYDGLNFHRVISQLHDPGRLPPRHRHRRPRLPVRRRVQPRSGATTAPACSRWRTPAPAPTAASSSSPTPPSPTSTTATPSSARSRPARTSSTPSARATRSSASTSKRSSAARRAGSRSRGPPVSSRDLRVATPVRDCRTSRRAKPRRVRGDLAVACASTPADPAHEP